MAEETQPWAESPRRVNCLPDRGQTIRDSGRWGGFALGPVARAGPLGAQEQEEQPGPQEPPLSLSLPELQPLFIILPHRDHSQGSGQAPRFLKTGTSCTYCWGTTMEPREQPACLIQDGVKGRWAGPHSGVGGVGWPAPGACPPSSSPPARSLALRAAPVGGSIT